MAVAGWLGTSYPPPDALPPERWQRLGLTREAYLGYYESMVRERAMRDQRAPIVGQRAPDFELDRLSPAGKRTGERFRLSSARGRPVALVFGSYTWPPFRDQAVRLNEIYDEYRDRIDFYCVYIQEAHPTDGQQAAKNLDEKILYEQPKSIDEREELAQVCMLRLDLRMPTLLDNMDNEVDRLYAALPDRLYLLDENGMVVHRSVVGSPGFDVEAWYSAIVRLAGISPVLGGRRAAQHQ